MKDVAAELRARAEKARAEANRSAASDGLLYAGLMVEARTYDEAASLVEALRSPARVDPADFDALDDYFFGDTEGSKRAEEAWERISAALKGEDDA